MGSSSLLQTIHESLGTRAQVKSVFGDPISAEGKTIVPVAKVAYGFGGGSGTGGVGQGEEPLRPRSIDARIPRDLETIVLKAIDKDPARRYATADAIAEDLRRYLADEPIQARRTSTAESCWVCCSAGENASSANSTAIGLRESACR